ncbi:MAG: type IX secretion system outer membrane channel protein PorV [Cyclobacteriaceae bacterium]|nr:type IX secretion system outer membrane channel protein PorV [Cyclobacteriaceae bacterium]
MKFKIVLFICAFFAANSSMYAQVNVAGQDTSRRVITTAVPFLLIATDARAGAMGDAGVATSPDANATHWNIAKLAFIKNDIGFSLSYTPWLAKIINDMSLSYLSGYYKINKEQSVGLSLSYFDLGNIQFTDEFGEALQNYNPREFSFSGSYARLLSENMSIGVTLKYIRSNLTGNVFSSTSDGQAGVSIAADLGWYWNKDIGQNSNLALGATITDIGNKITYSNDEQKEFIPTTLRFGGAYTLSLDPHNSLTFALDFNKLMVPTPPVYVVDDNGRVIYDQNGNPEIARGKDPDRSLLSGMFGSFTDAPDGASEELKEVMIGGGIEYWYRDLFALRGGYFWEDYEKGDRKYFTMGLGLRYNVFGIDFAYLVPQKKEHPLAETLRFTLHFNFNNKKVQESIIDEDTN